MSSRIMAVTGAVTTVCLMLSATHVSPQQLVEQPVIFKVRPEITYQRVEGFGAGIYPGTPNDMESLTANERKRLYDLVYGSQGTHLNIARLLISFQAQALPPNHPLRAKGLRYNWHEDTYTQLVYEALQPILKRTKPILYAVPFTPPIQWKSDKRPNLGGVLLPEYYQEYADYLADFVNYYQKEHGLTIDVLSLQNEPDVAAPWESARWTGEELQSFLKVIGPTFRQRGLTTKLMVSEGSSWAQAWVRAAPSLRDDAARQYVSILASHSYNYGDQVQRGRELMRAASERYAIPLWMTEMSIIGPPDDPTMTAATSIAYTIYRDLVEANASAWIYCFVIFNPAFPGSMGVLSPPNQDRLVIPKRFWAIANYSRFIRPGWQRIEIEGLGFANAGFISPERDRFAIVALNAIPSARPATYDFDEWEVTSVQAFCTSSERDLASIEGVQRAPHSFSATLTPLSVTTFVGTLWPPHVR